MKRIILIALLLFVGRESAWAGTCENGLGLAFTPAQRTSLCNNLGDAIFTNPTVSGNLTFSSANARIVPGTSSVSFRNNANSASNLQIVDNGEITVRNDLIFNDSAFFIYPNTADAADTSAQTLLGGGASGSSRGASLIIAGNEHANTGRLTMVPGNVVGGSIDLTSIQNGVRILNGSSLAMWTFGTTGALTSDATNGGDLILNKSGSGISIQENSASTACMGTSAPNGTTPVVVTTSCATSGARVFYSRNGAVTNNASISTTTAPNGTSFSFASTNGADTGGASVVWFIVKESA